MFGKSMSNPERIVNTDPVERIYPDDERVKIQTIAHHVARYDFASKLVKPQKYSRALDIGSGSGYGSEMLRQVGYDTKGIELNHQAVSYAQQNFPENDFIQGDITEFIPHGRYNLITFFEVIEHLTPEDASDVLTRAQKLLHRDGIMVISTPRDINEENNGFHKSEWSYEEFQETLEETFSQVVIFGQDWDTAEITDENVKEEDFYIAICKK